MWTSQDLSKQKRPTELTPLQYLAVKPNKQICSRCGVKEERADKECIACLCWRCTNLMANLQAKGYWKTNLSRLCPDCQAFPLRSRQRVCSACAAKRVNESAKNRVRKMRATHRLAVTT